VDHPGGETLWRGVFIVLTHASDLRK